MTRIKQPPHPAILLFCLILFHLISNYFWLSINEMGPVSDEKNYFNKSIRLYRILADPDINLFPRIFTSPPAFRPPLFPLCLVPSYPVAGLSYRSAASVITLFLALMIVFTYKIGKLLYSAATGLLAAFIISFFPFTLKYSRLLFSEMALTAALSIAIWFLLKSRSFRERKYSIGLGVAIGAGMLIKQSFIFFMALPFLFEGIKGLFFPHERRPDLSGKASSIPFLAQRPGAKTNGINFIFSILISAALSVPYYVICFHDIKAMRIMNKLQGSTISLKEAFTIKHLFWAGSALWNLTGALFFVFFLVGLAVSLKRKYRKATLLLWLAGGGGFTFLLLQNRTRYLFPLLPVCALLISFWLVKIRNLLVKWILLVLLFINSLLTYAWMTWGFSPFNLYSQPLSVRLPETDYRLDLIPRPRPPEKIGDWKINAIIDEIAGDSAGKSCNFLVVPFLDHFTHEYFQSRILIEGLPIEISVPDWRFFGLNYWALFHADYILTKTGRLRLEWATPDFRKEFSRFLCDPPPAWKRTHRLLKIFTLPDGSRAELYKRVLPLSLEERRQILQETIKIDPDNRRARRELRGLNRKN